MAGVEDGGERLHKGSERGVDLGTKIVMDRSVLPLDLRDDLPYVGFETCIPLVGAAGYFFLQMFHLVRQGLFKVIDGRDLLRDFAQVVAFRGQCKRIPEHVWMTREDAAEKLQVGGSLYGQELLRACQGKAQYLGQAQRCMHGLGGLAPI